MKPKTSFTLVLHFKFQNSETKRRFHFGFKKHLNSRIIFKSHQKQKI